MNLKRLLQFLSVLLLLVLNSTQLMYAQTLTESQANGSRFNSIRTAVPFLLITPDARVGAMGEAGVAIAPDANSLAINPSKIAFLEQQSGFSISYSPWLKNIASDINLGYLSGFYKLDANSTIGSSLRYFSLGKIQLTDVNQQDLGTFSPSELAVDVTYARRFGDSFSLGTALRYINSNIATNQFSAGQDTRAGQALAVDVSAYFKKPTYLLGHDAIVSAGVNISNIGTKMSYSDAGDEYFLPTNLKIGAAGTFILDDQNEITIALDFNKLLVPTQPLYNEDGSIQSGRDPNRSVPAGIFGSFTDAPGGAGEEFKEINIASGLEYWYNKKFALRAGYFYENPQKGDRRYFTMGTGIRYNNMELNISYLLANPQKSPLANTLRFSLLFNFGDTEQ
ncbi:type IX secretion system outer membrane channel protein PorV [Pedobacter sp. MC2016-15]|uniref:type IX secretion system outer membrane channel protein PorV n=1 Tax=Pedobacter sp. MC2016-15 TaxID=2994473 RepID=UPI002245A7ED|nr:type IX secretion system outer membrane channel protein PorV [Pedobacter sp. MC2016-15]MCX2481713.1 type IX secretion system outer membrane channel protein PorV [Pedobacter sp. MC2016-15]